MRSNRSMPTCTVIPVLGYPDVGAAVEWLCSAFGFTLRLRIGDHRAQLSVGDGAVVIAACDPQCRPFDCVMVRVEIVDDHHAKAKAVGAEILQPPTDYPYGERQYVARDFLGRSWTFSQTIDDVAPERWGALTALLDRRPTAAS